MIKKYKQAINTFFALTGLFLLVIAVSALFGTSINAPKKRLVKRLIYMEFPNNQMLIETHGTEIRYVDPMYNVGDTVVVKDSLTDYGYYLFIIKK